MTLPNPLRIVFLLVLACLMGSEFSPCLWAESKSAVASNPTESQTASDDSAAKQSPDEDKSEGTGFGLFPMDSLHEIIRQEREVALSEVDNERKDTLAYLSQERQTVVEALTTETHRITELLQAERQTTMLELEVMGNRMIQNAISDSKALIDHLILRIIELAIAVILLLSLVGSVGYRLWWSRR